jgi:hypothetical protein
VSTKPWGWKKGPAVRALTVAQTVAQQAGLTVTGYTINTKDGTATVQVAKDTAKPDSSNDEVEQWLSKNARKTAS